MNVRSHMAYQINQLMNNNDPKIAVKACNLAQNRTIRVTLDFYLTCTKSCANRMGTLSTSKPDLDNLIKFYLDCGNGILWLDDRFIGQLTSSKWYDTEPRTVIKLEHVTHDDRQISSDEIY